MSNPDHGHWPLLTLTYFSSVVKLQCMFSLCVLLHSLNTTNSLDSHLPNFWYCKLQCLYHILQCWHWKNRHLYSCWYDTKPDKNLWHGLWNRHSEDNPDGPIAKIRHGSDWGSVQVCLSSSTSLHRDRKTTYWGWPGMYRGLVKNEYLGIIVG